MQKICRCTQVVLQAVLNKIRNTLSSILTVYVYVATAAQPTKKQITYKPTSACSDK